MSTNGKECGFEQKSIEIMQIDNPHKFWYKYLNDFEQELILKELELELTKYANEYLDWDESVPKIKPGDVIAVKHPNWKKWIRGKAGDTTGDDDDGLVRIWAIDYGCEMDLPLQNIVILEDKQLAYGKPKNVHIGGLSDILPAVFDFNVETFVSVLKENTAWSATATNLMKAWVGNSKNAKFEFVLNQSGRYFGKLLLDDEFDVAEALVNHQEALPSADYLNAVCVLERDDFFRMNHQMSQPREEIAEPIDQKWWNNDLTLDSASELTASVPDALSEYDSHPSSVSQRTHSVLKGCPTSAASITQSIKSLNRLNVVVLCDDEYLTPTNEWKDAHYFSDQMQKYLYRLYPKGIDTHCSFGWAHLMRGNSLLVIGDPYRNILLCLPTACAVASEEVSHRDEDRRAQPTVIIFVNGTENICEMMKECRNFLKKTALSSINVSRFDKDSNADTLKLCHIDILVTSVFLYEDLVRQMPMIFKSDRLRYVWFDQVYEMNQNNSLYTQTIMNNLLSMDLDVQVVLSTEKYCPTLPYLFSTLKRVPMLLVGDQTPFEAALFAECKFTIEFIGFDMKIQNLIQRLRYDTRLTGSIVIVCANEDDVKMASGHLTQANIKCSQFDSLFSGNQMKLVHWTERSEIADHAFNHQNILICDDNDVKHFPIRTANHIVHFSLPNNLDTFLQRFITCFGLYTEKLRRDLLKKEETFDIVNPTATIYFDDKLTDDFTQIYQLLSERTQCTLPSSLTEVIEKMKSCLEVRKGFKPLCIELITTAKICDIECPYRHWLSGKDSTSVPEYGFVNMKLLEVLAPNHYSVQVIGHKRKMKYKSRHIESAEQEWSVFKEEMRNYYSDEQYHEKVHSIDVGDLCLIFIQNEPKRCRILSIARNAVHIFLIDDGKSHQCMQMELFELHEDFKEFPAKAIEVFVLGIKPSQHNTKWLPEAKLHIESLMAALELQSAENYLQAEVLKAFERTLIVKDLKVISPLWKKGNILANKRISKILIKRQLAVEAPINWHTIFNNTTECNSSSVYSESIPSNGRFSLASIDSLDDLCGSAVKIRRTSNIESELEFGGQDSALVNSAASLNDIFHNSNEVDLLHSFNEPETFKQPTMSTNESMTNSSQSLDEILGGSAPESLHAVGVLTPIKTSQDLMDSANQEKSYTEWLIKFDDNINGNTDEKEVMASPSANMRHINSIDDFF